MSNEALQTKAKQAESACMALRLDNSDLLHNVR